MQTDKLLAFAKLPPQALELEAAVIGALMMEGHRLDDVREILTDGDIFYKRQHQVIYAAILSLRAANKQIDLLTITEELTKLGNLEAAGGAYGVTILTSNVVSSAHLETHAEIIAHKRTLRELIISMQRGLAACYDVEANAADIIADLSREVSEMGDTGSVETVHHISEAMLEAAKELETAMQNPGHLTGVDTGLKAVNMLTNGWQRSDLIVLAARPSQGKTALALELSRACALSKISQPKPVLFFSLEMGKVQLAKRQFAAGASVEMGKIQRGDVSTQEFTRIVDELNRSASFPLYLDDKPGLTLLQLCGKARRFRRRHGIAMIVIDYLQLISAKKEKGRNREQEIAEITRTLKQLAKELQIPIIALSQMNRDNDEGNRKPRLSDLRESGAIEQDADVVCFIWHEKDGNSGSVKNQLVFAKHRNGATDTIEVIFEGATQRWKDMPDAFDIDAPPRFNPYGGMRKDASVAGYNLSPSSGGEVPF